jgi:hypothetical protein
LSILHGKGSSGILTACRLIARTVLMWLSVQAGDNTVVLLARDTPPNHPSTRDLGVDMSQVRHNRLCKFV